MRDWLHIMVWRFLRKNRVFNYWYRRHLTELCYELELADIEQDRLIEKYRKKLEDTRE